MHSGGYLDRSVNTASPTRLGIIVALHGVALAALMLAPAEMIRKPDWGATETYPVPDDPPPPPEAIPQQPKQLPKETIDLPTTIVPTTSSTSIFTQTPPELDTVGTAETPFTPITTPVRIDATFLKGVEIQPAYPPSLARQDIEGVVTVRVLIGTDGRVKAVEQVSASEPEFFEATRRQAMRYWRFKPATSDGMAVESWRQMTVRFKLEA
jgi:periplasmic protein TonB